MCKESINKRAILDVRNVLFELGIIDGVEDIPPLNKNLRDDLGLDSQELVSVAVELSSLSVCHQPLHEADMTSVNDLVVYLEQGRDVWLPTDTQYILQGAVIINQNIETVFSYI